MHVLLTDDEIVALSSLTQRPWPFPLKTVNHLSSGDVGIATMRGVRSLTVRGLAESTSEGAIGIASDLNEGFVGAAAAELAVIAHVSGRASVTYEGSAVAAFGSGGLLLNSTTPEGIHAFGDAREGEALDVIGRYVRSRFDKADARASSDYCVLVASSRDDRVFEVTEGSVRTGRVGAVDGAQTFQPDEASPSSLDDLDRFLQEQLSR